MSGKWNGNGRCEFETELAEMPSWKAEYDLWHPNRQSMSDDDRNGAMGEETTETAAASDVTAAIAVPGRSTGQRRRGDGGRGAGRASSDLGGSHRVGGGGGADAGSQRPDGGDAVDGRRNRTEGRPHALVSCFPRKKAPLSPESRHTAPFGSSTHTKVCLGVVSTRCRNQVFFIWEGSNTCQTLNGSMETLSAPPRPAAG